MTYYKHRTIYQYSAVDNELSITFSYGFLISCRFLIHRRKNRTAFVWVNNSKLHIIWVNLYIPWTTFYT